MQSGFWRGILLANKIWSHRCVAQYPLSWSSSSWPEIVTQFSHAYTQRRAHTAIRFCLSILRLSKLSILLLNWQHLETSVLLRKLLWSQEVLKHNGGNKKKKWGFFKDFLGGYIPKITENRHFFRRYHAKNWKLALWWPPNLGVVSIRAP
jgi:hypothetical protein